MLTVALHRFRSTNPRVELRVVNRHPDYFSARVGPVTFVDPKNRRAFYQGFLPNKIANVLSKDGLRDWQIQQTGKLPQLTNKVQKIFRRDVGDSSAYFQQLIASDALIITGGGIINDSFLDLALSILDEAEFMMKLNKPVFFFGLGLGPMDNPLLFAKAKKVLPHVNHLYLREGVHGIPLAEKLGIPHNKYTITGDDAIELAYPNRPPEIGHSIGVNLRFAEYSGLGKKQADEIRPIVQEFSRSVDTDLRIIPISLLSQESDRESAQQILDGFEKNSSPVENLESIEGVIAEAGQCRVVITASYHAGVFALSQGVSVIGISASPYYDSKFEGLSQQFAGGCRYLTVGTTFTPENFRNLLQETWQRAPEKRQEILDAAKHQLQLSRNAYQEVFQQLGLSTN